MIIKSIKLKNIRSYVEQEIKFNEGITVLSGDIGSGKSTILFAIEFALFGLLENDSGNSLLRKGTNEGYVELTVEINKKEVFIQRFLKRKPEGIRQTNGILKVNGEKKDLTPIELKQEVLNLLGYPNELLSKKSLIYHFTTYTPQDQMKQILHENSDERVDIIRKLFGIDKYRRIIENSAVFSRFLRENKREILGKISDLENKKNELKNITMEESILKVKEKEVDEKLMKAKEKTKEARENLLASEIEIKKLFELKKEKAILENSIKQKQEYLNKTKSEIENLEKDINLLKKQTNSEKIQELKSKIKENLHEEIVKLEQEIFDTQKIFAEHEAHKKHSEKIKNQLESIDDCPLCLQKVSAEHKLSIIGKENEKIHEVSVKMTDLLKKFNELKVILQNKKKESEENKNIEKELSIIKLQVKNVSEKEQNLISKKEFFEKTRKELAEISERYSKMHIPDSEKREEEHMKLKKGLENAMHYEKSSEIEKIKISTELKNLYKLKEMFDKEIKEKEESKAKLNEIAKKEEWLGSKFSDLVMQMEKHVLGKVYFTFNEEFKNLFGILIPDEKICSKIDETFTPKLEQNGHEIEFSNLSGGEKTSTAMAYRLALNKSINKMTPSIMTNGLLLLDEPTDGFSSEQINSMKDLFYKLDIPQIIIVSHENEIESLANYVIRVVKNRHESTILA